MANDTCIRLLADPIQINQCKSILSENQESFHRLSEVLSLAGNEVRFKILYLLSVEKQLCPCDLSDILGMTIPAVSQHLRKLKDGRVIIGNRVGQTIFYSLCLDPLKLLKPLFSHIQPNISV
ncbi:ArsR/SmtB family transcription factor [Algoriphagus sp.]|uniref:ArsR/SmtB family transcription factor n=1 Tax=Algoriphagus sp. TaxID=1872435 RepID=UPI00391DE676